MAHIPTVATRSANSQGAEAANAAALEREAKREAEFLARREAAKDAALTKLGADIEAGLVWPVTSGLLKALIRAYKESPQKADDLLGRLLTQAGVPALAVPDQKDIGQKGPDGEETRVSLPREEWFRKEPRIALVNPGAFWELSRANREAIESAFPRPERPKHHRNGNGANGHNGRHYNAGPSPLGNKTGDRREVERRREESRRARHAAQPRKGSGGEKKEKGGGKKGR
ncbi:MAG: hypothetical protein AAB421_02775 [Patescibacteria group bacterium]